MYFAKTNLQIANYYAADKQTRFLYKKNKICKYFYTCSQKGQ